MESNIVISGSSDIGFEFIKNRNALGDQMIGTYRDENAKDKLKDYCSHTIYLDLFSKESKNNFINYIAKQEIFWDKILFCPCQTFPYKSFFECNFLRNAEYKIFLVEIFNPSHKEGIDLCKSSFEKCFNSL